MPVPIHRLGLRFQEVNTSAAKQFLLVSKLHSHLERLLRSEAYEARAPQFAYWR